MLGLNSRVYRNSLKIKQLSLLNYKYLSIQNNTEEIRKSPTPSVFNKLKIYADLSKYRLSSLVVLTTGAGFLCAGSPIDWTVMLSTCTGTALCAASANSFNQVFEREHDKLMNRTRNRPLPSGKIGAIEATSWAAAAGIAGTGILYAAANPVVALLGASNIILYAGPYTLSKRYSEINTWIGSVVGAIPPVMGWAAASGGAFLQAEPMALASLLFLWQFPHFFALSWLHREDYARGGFHMVAVNDPHGQRSANLILQYTMLLTALPIATSISGLTSYMFALEGTLANLYLLYLAKKFQENHSNGNARKIFLCSLWYLPVLMTGFVFHGRQWNSDEEKDKLSEVVLKTKDNLKGVCLHNVMSNNQNAKLCPKIVSEKVVDAVTEGVAIHNNNNSHSQKTSN